MTVVQPEGTPTLGNTKVAAVVTVADLAAPKLATEINAVTSVDISCYLYADGWTPSGSQAKQARKRRLCSRKDVESLHTVTYTIGALRYSHDPQAADAAAGNEARELLQQGVLINLVERQGLDALEDPFTVAERVRTHYVELGEQFESADTDENGEFYIMQEVSYVNDGPVVGIIAT